MLNDSTMVDVLATQYGFSPVRLTWFDSLYAKDVAARFESDGQLYKLKRYSARERDLYTLAHRHVWVQNQPQTQVPIWRMTVSNDLFVVFDDHLLYVTDWVSGRPFAHNVSDAHLLGRSLASIHALQPSSEFFDLPRLETRLRPVVEAKRMLSNGMVEQMREPIRGFLRKEQHTLRRQMHDPLKVLRSLRRQLPLSVLHGDVTIPNLLYDEHCAKFIDWENVNAGFAAEELAKTAMNTCNLSVELVDALLDGYGWHRMSTSDQAAFRSFLHIPREVVYLLHKAGKRSPNEHDKAQWQLVMQTWRDRETLLNRYPLDLPR